MSITPNLYAKARSEIIALFGWDAGSLSPDQTLRVDCAVALRLALDDLQGRIVRGESADVARMLTASEALARLLPPAVLSTPPAEEHGDPRQVMWELYRTMRERGELAGPKYSLDAALKRIDELEAQLAGKTLLSPDNDSFRLKDAITPPTSDIVPPSERAECDAGPRPGPDDWRAPRPGPVIDGKAVPNPPAAPPAKPAWENWVDAELAGAHYSDPWANRG